MKRDLGLRGITVGRINEVIILKENAFLHWANNLFSRWIQLAFLPKYIIVLTFTCIIAIMLLFLFQNVKYKNLAIISLHIVFCFGGNSHPSINLLQGRVTQE